MGLRLRQGANLHSPVPQVADRPDRVRPAPADAVYGDHHQGVAAGKADVELMPSLAHLSTDGAGDTDVAVDVGQGYADSPELQLLAEDVLQGGGRGSNDRRGWLHLMSRATPTHRNSEMLLPLDCSLQSRSPYSPFALQKGNFPGELHRIGVHHVLDYPSDHANLDI